MHRKWWTLFAVSVATFMLLLDITVVNTALPAITGTATVGQQLSASTGTWTGSPAPTFAFQWLRCDSAGANCAPIGGATAQTYTLVTADGGQTVAVRVTATNAEGTPAAYTTRIIVTRPVDAADFNGTVVLDWVNVTAQFENAVTSLEAREQALPPYDRGAHEGVRDLGIDDRDAGDVDNGELAARLGEPVEEALHDLFCAV